MYKAEYPQHLARNWSMTAHVDVRMDSDSVKHSHNKIYEINGVPSLDDLIPRTSAPPSGLDTYSSLSRDCSRCIGGHCTVGRFLNRCKSCLL